jgi:hypothetical protein
MNAVVNMFKLTEYFNMSYRKIPSNSYTCSNKLREKEWIVLTYSRQSLSSLNL